VSVGAAGLTAGYSDALSRITQIQDQIASLGSAFTPATSSAAGDGSTATTSTSSGTASSFATQLQSALAGSAAGSSETGDLSTDSSLLDSGLTGYTGLTSASGVTGATSLTGTTATSALPTAASTLLTSDQQQFASRLASDTGLDPGVVSAWLLAEESGSAATGRQSQGNNDWLNIGYTDSGTYGSSDSVWSDPVTAADATAGWLKGQDTIPGYGTASSSIQGILQTAGQAPAAQIEALQGSGWASSGYPSLDALYAQVTG
jgi:hypothetical protein